MGGDHKIWTLRAMSTLQSAQKALKPVRWPVPDQDQKCLTGPIVMPKITRTSISKRATVQQINLDRLDLWPAEMPVERFVSVGKEKADRDVQILSSDGGFVQLVDFVPVDVQQRLIDELRSLGISDQGFFPEGFDGLKVSANVSRMYLGTHWNTKTRTWEATRSNLDGQPPLAIPKTLFDVYFEAVKRVNRELKTSKIPGTKKKYATLPEPSATSIGVAVVNFYTSDASMELHQDKTEPRAVIDKGFPVLTFALVTRAI